MDLPLSVFQKLILRMALQNREAAGVIVNEVVIEHEIQQIDADGTTTSEKYLAPELKPDKDGWVDLEQDQVLKECFGIAYTPTFEEEFGMVTSASEAVESRQYYAAEELIHEAMLELPPDLAEQYFSGPCAWDGFPNRMSIMLTEEGAWFTAGLRAELFGNALDLTRLDAKTESRYRALLRKKGVPEDEMIPSRFCPTQNRPVRETPVSFFLGLLEDRNLSRRHMAITALRQIGPEAAEAIPALKQAVEDPVPAIRLIASWALKEFEQRS
jgi:hypothetical protein